MLDKYILRGKEITPEPDIKKWAESQKEGIKHVQNDVINGVTISTVFLGTDHSFSGIGPPILFETMIFGGDHDYYQERCCTWEEAEQMHKDALKLVRDSK